MCRVVTIAVVSRLAYRKGIDLLVEVIPEICARHPNIRWLIGGDGPKREALEQMRYEHELESRVLMLGVFRAMGHPLRIGGPHICYELCV